MQNYAIVLYYCLPLKKWSVLRTDRVFSEHFQETWLLSFSTGAVTIKSISGSPTGGISEGSTVSITCIAACDNGTCQFSWNPTTLDIQTNSTHSVYRKAIVNRADAGTYTCRVVDDGDQVANSTNYTLTVYCKYTLRMSVYHRYHDKNVMAEQTDTSQLFFFQKFC